MKDFSFNVIDQYNDPAWKRGFKIDAYLPDHKIGFEVNGDFKYNPDGRIKTYYQKRAEVIESHGIRIINIRHSKVFSLSKTDIEELMK